jgi:hypothetical protein
VGNFARVSQPRTIDQYPFDALMARIYPFLVSGILIIVGLVATSRLDGRLNRYVTGDSSKNSNDELSVKLAHLQPGSLRNVVIYWIDMTQSSALLVGPVLGILVFVNLAHPLVAAAYAVSILIAIGLILWLALLADESTYNSRGGKLGLTPVTTAAIIVDIAAGAVAYFAGR